MTAVTRAIGGIEEDLLDAADAPARANGDDGLSQKPFDGVIAHLTTAPRCLCEVVRPQRHDRPRARRCKGAGRPP